MAFNPLVSVVIPCFKQAHLLAESIESVLAQDYRRCDIIVVDDGSPDDVASVVERFPNIRYIRQSNQGISAARNTGMTNCEGEYIVFLDSDDRLLPEALSIGASHLDSRSGCVMVWGQCRHIDVDGKPIDSHPKPRIEFNFYSKLLETNFIRTPGVVMYRRDAVLRINGFRTKFDLAEDYDLNLRLMRNYDVFCHYEVVLEYRVHDSSAMNDTRRTAKAFRMTLDALSSQWPFVRCDIQLQAAYSKGRDAWIRQYSQRIKDELARNLGSRDTSWVEAWKSGVVLLRFAPRGLLSTLRHWVLNRHSSVSKNTTAISAYKKH